jgi:hypothetical protein
MNTKEKARIVESAEAAHLAAIFDAATPEVRENLGMRIYQVWGGVASIMKHDPTGGYMSRIVGIGIDRPITLDFLEAIDALYISNAADSAILQISPMAQPSDFEELISGEGFIPWWGSLKFLRELHDIPTVHTEFAIREIGPHHAQEFGHIYWEGFGYTNPSLVQLMANEVGRPDWKIFGAFHDKKIIAVASMYARGDVACLSGSTTLPEYRHHGAQTALLAARLKVAAKMDLSWASAEAPVDNPETSDVAEEVLRHMGF